MTWLKLHDDFVFDPKMRRYFTKAERLDWVNLLCLANKSKERGVILMPDEEIAYSLDLSDDEWLSFVQKMTTRGMVKRREDDGALVLVNWVARQYDKPSDTPEATRDRKARQREREATSPSRFEEPNVTPPVTPPIINSHAMSRPTSRPVTPPVKRVTPGHALDKIRVEESRKTRREQSSLEQLRAAQISSAQQQLREEQLREEQLREEQLRGGDGEGGVTTPGDEAAAAAERQNDDSELLRGKEEPPGAYVKRVLPLMEPHIRSELDTRWKAARDAKRAHAEWPWKAKVLSDWVTGAEPCPDPPETVKPKHVARAAIPIPPDWLPGVEESLARQLCRAAEAKVRQTLPDVSALDDRVRDEARRLWEEMQKPPPQQNAVLPEPQQNCVLPEPQRNEEHSRISGETSFPRSPDGPEKGGPTGSRRNFVSPETANARSTLPGSVGEVMQRMGIARRVLPQGKTEEAIHA